MYMLHVFATPSLATWRPQEESLRSGSRQDVTRASLSDRFRARGEEVSWRWLRSGLYLPCVPAPPLSCSPFRSFLPSFLRRGLSEEGVQRGYFAMRRRRTARAFRDTSVIIRRGCRNRVPARGRALERMGRTLRRVEQCRKLRDRDRRWGWKIVSRWSQISNDGAYYLSGREDVGRVYTLLLPYFYLIFIFKTISNADFKRILFVNFISCNF